MKCYIGGVVVNVNPFVGVVDLKGEGDGVILVCNGRDCVLVGQGQDVKIYDEEGGSPGT